MKFIETGDPDLLRTKRGGGMAMLFGIAFLLTGILIIGLSFDVPETVPWYVPASFGSVFLILGIVLTFGRNGIIIDRKKMTMVHWTGLMIPMKVKPYPLEVYDHISITMDIIHNEEQRYKVYPVAIRSKHGNVNGLIFHEPSEYIEARNNAEKISAFLGLPIIDTSSGEEVVRRPGQLDKTLREKKSDSRPGLPSPPINMASRISDDKEKLLIDILPRKLTSVELKRMAFLLIIGIVSLCVIAGLSELRNLWSGHKIFYIPISILIILFAIKPVLHQAKQSWKITVTRDLLRVDKLGAGPRSTTEIPLNELEELLIGEPTPGGIRRDKISLGEKLTRIIQGPGRKVITANSDKSTVAFGNGIDERELEYLYQLIKKNITETCTVSLHPDPLD